MWRGRCYCYCAAAWRVQHLRRNRRPRKTARASGRRCDDRHTLRTSHAHVSIHVTTCVTAGMSAMCDTNADTAAPCPLAEHSSDSHERQQVRSTNSLLLQKASKGGTHLPGFSACKCHWCSRLNSGPAWRRAVSSCLACRLHVCSIPCVSEECTRWCTLAACTASRHLRK